MAIYSLRHTPIGRSTQNRPHTAAAHIGYISRPQAARHVMAERMPDKPKAAADYLKEMENGDRVNARVADKVMLALPKELTEQQRVQLVRDFANDVTKGKASWLAAIHDKGKDVDNPHCHLVVRDRDPATGKRVIGMSDAGSTDMLREKWERHANRTLELAGYDARIDRRSLKAQGIDRAPTIHEGPNIRAMESRGARPHSRPRQVRNGRGARRPSREVNYPSIDKGQTRPGYNRALKAQESEVDYWDAIDQNAQRREFEERGLGADFRCHQKAGQRPASVHDVRRFPSQAEQSDHAGRVPPFDRPLGIPANLPGNAAGLRASPARFEPTPGNVARREGKNDATDNFSKRPVGTKLTHKHPEARNVEDHIDSIGQYSHPSNEGQMSDQDDEWLGSQHAQRLNAAQLQADQSRGRFDDLMKRSYLNPQGAEKAMDGYRAKHGEQALYDRLNRPTLNSPTGHGMAFGRRPGSILSTDYLNKGAGDRQMDSLDTRRQLGDAYKRMHQDREALRAAKQTDDNFRARQEAARQPTQAPSSELHPSQQHKGLEQKGRPNGPAPAPQQPDPSRMSPEQRQAGQHKGLERPQSTAPAEPHPGHQHRGLLQKGQPKGPAPASQQPDPTRMSPEQRQAGQHRGMEQPQPKAPAEPHPGRQHKGLEHLGQPAPQIPSQAPEPDWSRMSPEARQANQHRLMEPPLPAPAGPVMAPPPAGMVGRTLKGAPPSELNQPQMAPAPEPSAAKSVEPRLKKDRGMEM